MGAATMCLTKVQVRLRQQIWLQERQCYVEQSVAGFPDYARI